MSAPEGEKQETGLDLTSIDASMAPDEKLHRDAEEKLNAMLKNNDVDEMALFRNHSASDDGHATGYVAVTDRNTKLTAEMIPNSLFETFVIARIIDPNGDINEKLIQEKTNQLDSVTPVTVADGPKLSKKGKTDGIDSATWSPEIGTKTGFAGIFKRTQNGGWEDEFFIGVRAGVPKAVEELREKVMARKGDMTIGQFIGSDGFAYVKYLSERNAKRMVWNIARKMGLKVSVQQDVCSYYNKNTAQPNMAYNVDQQMISDMIYDSNRNHYCIMSEASPVSSSVDKFFVIQGPREGILQFDTRKSTVNVAAPCTTRFVRGKPTAKQSVKDIAQVSRRFLYPNKARQSVHPHLAPEAYDRVDDEFRNNLDEFGFNDVSNVLRYHSVLVKIANRA